MPNPDLASLLEDRATIERPAEDASAEADEYGNVPKSDSLSTVATDVHCRISVKRARWGDPGFGQQQTGAFRWTSQIEADIRPGDFVTLTSGDLTGYEFAVEQVDPASHLSGKHADLRRVRVP